MIEGLREGFPDLFVDLDFDVAGQIVTARIQAPWFDEMMPVHLAPEGWFMALLHLAAVASAERGGVVAIDEPENGLHPYAMRRLVETMSDWAAEHQVHILLATHSPVLLDQFKREPERVFVMEARRGDAARPPRRGPRPRLARALLARRSVHARGVRRPGSERAMKTVKLIVTGDLEAAALHHALQRIFHDVDLSIAVKLDGFTSAELPDPPRAARHPARLGSDRGAPASKLPPPSARNPREIPLAARHAPRTAGHNGRTAGHAPRTACLVRGMAHLVRGTARGEPDVAGDDVGHGTSPFRSGQVGSRSDHARLCAWHARTRRRHGR